MAPFRSNVRLFDALTAFLIALCLHMVLGMLWERGARHAQRNWSCYYVLTPSSPIFKRVVCLVPSVNKQINLINLIIMTYDGLALIHLQQV